MTDTIRLLRSIGYPNGDTVEPVEIVEDRDLYQLARKNKIGSLYIQVLNEHHALDELEAEWDERKQYQENLETTYGNLSTAMERFDGAVVKSYFPFWADSSDVDVIVYGEEMRDLKPIFVDLGYEVSGIAPTALSVKDPDTEQLIDVQTDFGLHNVLYFDKQTIDVERRLIKGHEVSVASRGSDLALHVNHSVTELMFTLKEFYTALFFLEEFDNNEFGSFIDKTRQNQSHNGCRAFFTAVKELSVAAFGTYPNLLDEISTEWGRSRAEVKRLKKTNYGTPYKYAPSSFFRYTFGKCRQRVFMRSLFRQLPHFANPKTAYYILSKVFSRVRREDYVNTGN